MIRMRIRCFAVAALLLGSGFLAVAQESDAGAARAMASGAASSATAVQPDDTAFDATSALSREDSVLNGRALLAFTTPDYPVTPGDVYALVFLRGATSDSISVMVPADYIVNLGVFGVLDARGLSFARFKERVEGLVAGAYPGSMPQLLIKSTGVFTVLCSGEARVAGQYQAWGLARLSQLWASRKTPYASSRRVVVHSANGKETAYDLFKAERFGDLSQDPYLRPGDSVILTRSARTVSLGGAVRRPGTYDLLPGDDLHELIEHYGDGFLEEADTGRITITRLVGTDDELGQSLYVSCGGEVPVGLMHRDVVTVASRAEMRPVCWFEGAVGPSPDGATLSASNKLPYVFVPGATLSKTVMALRSQFGQSADLAAAYLVRGLDVHPVDLSLFLYSRDFSSDMVLQPGDRVVVPFKQLFVTVAGAVRNPGRYPYIPDRSWEYYINLAGGFDTDKNAFQALDIFGVNDERFGKDHIILPEDTIVARSNSGIYQFGRVAGILSTVISLGTLTVTILNYMTP